MKHQEVTANKIDMNLIQRDDPRYQTPYDRHKAIILVILNDYKIVDSWEEAQEIWWNSIPQFISHIEVLDKKTNSEVLNERRNVSIRGMENSCS